VAYWANLLIKLQQMESGIISLQMIGAMLGVLSLAFKIVTSLSQMNEGGKLNWYNPSYPDYSSNLNRESSELSF
jgi:hypothetical protein